jgi:DNA-binding protein HU-beta
MNKQDLVNKVAEQFGLSKRQAGEIADFIFGDVMNTVRSGGEAAIAGFGSFRLVYRKARQGINPKTGEKISIPATRVPKFRPAKAFKEMVK